MSAYIQGTDVLGADAGQVLVIRVKNVADLVAQQGGKSGALAFKVVPQTITNKVYNTMRDKLLDGFRQQGVDADVQVVATAPNGGSSPSDLWTGVFLGAATVGLGIGLKKLLFR